MFPGFVHIYKDNENFVHLYFFSGLMDDGNYMYKQIDLSNIPFTYTYLSKDLVTDYKFDNKSIVKIKCQLVENKTNNIEKKILTLKK